VARNTMILTLLFSGIAAVLISFLLPSLLTPENTWSTSGADELQKCSQRIQKLASNLSKATSGDEKKRITGELAKEEETRASLLGSLEGSVNRPFWLSIVLLVAGIGMIVGGWCTYYFVPMPVEKKKTLAELDPDGTLAEKELTALDYTKAVRQSRGKHKSRH
jgi:hypothetical protein